MSLTNMQLSKREARGEIEAPDNSGPRYPYGLTLNLEKEVLDKLGIKELPEVGAEMIVVGIGIVESARMSKRQKGREDRSVSIQLTDIEVGPKDEASMEDAVDAAIKDA